MEIVKRVQRMKAVADEKRAAGAKIAFVPTMGGLHEGHLSLVRRGREMADVTVASIFVNPAQFVQGEDFHEYPRDLVGDEDKLTEVKVDFLFSPDTPSMYPEGFRTYVNVDELSGRLCGAFRPGHFRGVSTVVLKLLHIVRPHFLLLGRKDAQQLVILRRMVRDLNLDVEIVAAPTLRESGGLAMSSRNAYLSPEERRAALCLSRALGKAEELVGQGERGSAAVEGAVRSVIADEARARLQYAEIVDPETLEPRVRVEEDSLLALAVWIGETRLIDNTVLNPSRDRRE